MNMLPRSGLLSVGFALAFGLAAFAQDAAKNPVVALVDGQEILLSDVENVRRQLPAQAQNYSIETLFDLIIGNMVNTRLIAAEARRTGLMDDAAVKRRLAAIEAQILEQEFLSRKLQNAVTDAALQARYLAFLKKTRQAKRSTPAISWSRPGTRRWPSSSGSRAAKISPSWRGKNPPGRRAGTAAILGISPPSAWCRRFPKPPSSSGPAALPSAR